MRGLRVELWRLPHVNIRPPSPISSVLPLILFIYVCIMAIMTEALGVAGAAAQSKFPSCITYPSYSETRECGLPSGSRRLLNGWLCDPDNTISMSELYVIDETLQRIYTQYGDLCMCPSRETSGEDPEKATIESEEEGGGDTPCWYKFAFAFMRHLHEMSGSCAPGNGTYPSISGGDLTLRAQSYALAIRQKWEVGECGEDLLVLVLNQPPTPTLFLSWGPLIAEKLSTTSAIGGSSSYMSSHIAESMKSVLDEANAQLRRRYPLNRVLNNWLLKMVELLRKLNARSHSLHPRSHVPAWAWGVFAACGVAFALMAIGLCLLRSPNRRGNQRGKMSNADPSRRWKAGFAGGIYVDQ